VDPLIADSFVAAYREARAAFASEVTFGPVTISALVEAPREARDLVAGGFGDDGEATVRALVSDLTAGIPALGSPAQYEGKDYVVSHVRTRPGHPIAEIGIRPKNR
jgi:hypothetical protein